MTIFEPSASTSFSAACNRCTTLPYNFRVSQLLRRTRLWHANQPTWSEKLPHSHSVGPCSRCSWAPAGVWLV